MYHNPNEQGGHKDTDLITEELKEAPSPRAPMQTMREFLDTYNLASLEGSLIAFNVTMLQLACMNIDEIDNLCRKLNLDNAQEMAFRAALTQLQSEVGDAEDDVISRSATARSISHIVKEKRSTVSKQSKHQSQHTKDYDHLIKLVVVGDAGVGKSNLVVRFCDDLFQDGYISTIGVDFKFRTLQYNDILVKLQVWDTAGQERFRSITSAYYRSADGVFLCYDITSKSTFEALDNWIFEIRKHTQCLIMLVGCKLDIVMENANKRQVASTEAEAFAQKYQCEWIEVSAKSMENVDNLYFVAADNIMQTLLNEMKGDNNSINVDAPRSRKGKNRKCCK
mmetsp:Transcript_67263/g.106879  ORF Transcript_67263/g.106879 Transcript_67263/m.106879 type:complete len:337 (-) Transcript_67263:133-1143(-)